MTTNNLYFDLRRIRGVVNYYFNLNLEEKIRDSNHVMARLVFVKLVDVYYKDKKDKPLHKDILLAANLSENRRIPQLLREFDVYPAILQHYDILKHYVVDSEGAYTKEQIKKMLIDGQLTLTGVLDATIELNNLVGIGLVSLGQGLNDYCKGKIIIRE